MIGIVRRIVCGGCGNGQSEAARICMNELEHAAHRNSDPEAAHGKADDALIKFIRRLGYDDLADAWERVEKWYA